MSIIEKAVDRLDDLVDRSLHEPTPPAPGAGRSAKVFLEGAATPPESPAPAEAAGWARAALEPEGPRGPDADAETTGSRNAKRSRKVTLDLERLRAAGILTPGEEQSQIAEECRLIKRPILINAFGQDGVLQGRRNLIMVTSSTPGEGKTFTSISLAMSMAMELDRTVLLVDGDVLRGNISEVLGLESGLGLTDVMAGKVEDLADVLLKTDIPKLSLLPAGRPYPNSTELLASEAMRDVMDELSRRYPDRIVLFDSPPLLATSGASVLARLMGQVVLVVEAERTPRSAVKESLRMLEGCSVAGIVLNKARQRIWSGYGYGSKYGYGYGKKGYGYGRTASAES